jgi:PEP-CTERM motif
MKNKYSAAMILGLLAAPWAAQSALISGTFDITASNFTYYQGTLTLPPVDPLMINFSISFNNAGDITPTTAGLTVNTFNASYPISYAYLAAYDQLFIATSPASNANGCVQTIDSFCITINDASGLSPNPYYANQRTSSGGIWQTFTLSTTYTPAAVPLPSTLGLLSLGFAGLGFTGRRMKA